MPLKMLTRNRASQLLVGTSLLAAAVLAVAANTNALRVQTRAAILRAQPSTFEEAVGTLAYATEVEQVGTQGTWSEVQTTGASPLHGWLYTSALTKAAIYRSPDDVPPRSSVPEGSYIQVSNRGFGQKDVRRQFLNLHAEVDSMDFVLVDKMERQAISADSLRAFLIDGALIAQSPEVSR